MSMELYFQETPETPQPPEQSQLNEIYYNCTECSSPIEIITINETESSIEFKCINHNHKIKMLIIDYINEMKKYNDKNINNDHCNIHNKDYECYCLDCKINLCKDCLRSRKHINHSKNNILEIQPSEKEIKMMKNIIYYYDDEIVNLENEKKSKETELSRIVQNHKNELIEIRESKIKISNNNMKKEFQLNKENYISDIERIKKEYENKIKLRTYIYKTNIKEINNKYILRKEKINIKCQNKIEKLDEKYTKIIQKYEYDKKINNIKNLNRLNEIIYNAYDLYNKNYYNSMNFNNILINHLKNKKFSNNNLNMLDDEYQNIISIKNENENIENIMNIFEEKLKKFILDYEIDIETNIFNQYEENKIKLTGKMLSFIMNIIDSLENENWNLEESYKQIKKENEDLCQTIGDQNINIKNLEREKDKLENGIKDYMSKFSLKDKEFLNLNNQNEKNKLLYMNT